MAAGRLIGRLRQAADRRRAAAPAAPVAGGLDALWEEIELLERLQPPLSATVLQRRPGDLERARAELAPLKRWERISERSFGTYSGDTNHVRLHRLLRCVRDGDRVLDVGIGYGYVTAMLHRERRLGAYWGIDLREQFADAARDALQVNGLDPAAAELGVKSVLDLDAAWMGERRPDLALLLEVLEHIPDPIAALRALATTLPEQATVLFTVPILGRLDGVWGHVSRFDRRRIEQVCAEAGLTIHYVEPVYATWVLVAASPGTAVPDRVAALLADPPPAPTVLRRAAALLPHPAPRSYSVRPVYIGGSVDYRRPQHDPEHVRLKARLTGVSCQIDAEGTEPVMGGMRLAVREPELVRLELSCESAEHIEELAVLGIDADEKLRCGWTLKASRARPYDGARRSYLLRPGRASTGFLPHKTSPQTPDGVVALDVRMRVRAGGSAHLRLHRAAFAGPDPAD